jgi:hypothetical protein
MNRYMNRYRSGNSLHRPAGARAARRDRLSALNQLVLENRSTVYNLAFGLLGDPDLAVVATGETFVRAFLALPKHREQPSKQWLMEIAVSMCQEYLRRSPRLVCDSRVAGTLDSPEPGAEDDLDRPPSNPLSAARYPRPSDRCVPGQQTEHGLHPARAVEWQPTARRNRGGRTSDRIRVQLPYR